MLLVVGVLVAAAARAAPASRSPAPHASASGGGGAMPLSPARWHMQRRAAILESHPEVAQLIGKEQLTLPLLAASNVAQLACAVAAAQQHLPPPVLVPLAVLVGGTLSLWQFALLHDVKHGTAALPQGVRPDDVLFVGSLPALFGYYLYLRYGHLSHHKDFGRHALKTLFDSQQSVFEDGDALFVAHRQQMPTDAPGARVGFFGPAAVGGLGVSISRTIYSLLWLPAAAPREIAPAVSAASRAETEPAATAADATTDDGTAAAIDDAADADPSLVGSIARWGHLWGPSAYHAAVFAFSMTFERAALVLGGAVVPAVSGRNYFFAAKPDRFHATCATYARASMLLAAVLAAAAGPEAILWLFCAEVGWQRAPALAPPVGWRRGHALAERRVCARRRVARTAIPQQNPLPFFR